MAFRGVSVAIVCGLMAGVCAAEPRPTVEDPSYQPSTGAVRVTPTPGEVGLSNRSIESSVNLQLTEKKRSSASASKVTVRVDPAPAPVETTTTYPTALDPRTGTVRRIKYVLDGKNVFEGDPEPAPVASSPYSDPQPGVVEAAAPSSVAPVLPPGHVRNILSDPISGTTSAAPVAPARLTSSDDLTADKPGTVAAAEDKPLFEEITGEEHVSARARKCYAVLHEMKEGMESINRLLDNRGKENARLLNTTEKLINTISDMSDIWPTRDEFREACATAKRSALLFNEELNRAPWRWNYIRWSYTALLRDVRPLRQISKTMAEAEPKPQMVVGKDGKATYIDVDPMIDAATAAHDQKKRLEVEELARLRAANASGATKRKEAEEKVRRNLDEK